MTKDEKGQIIDSLAEKIAQASCLYLTDISTLNAENTYKLRQVCHEQNVELIVVKNTLLEKAFEKVGRDYAELPTVLKGHTSLMIADVANLPAKMIKDFRKKNGLDRPVLKGAYAEESVYIGENQLDALINIKSKNELIGDVILMLQSPMRNVLSGLQGAGQKIAGILKTLSEKES